ncbi:MAG: hypothetical protein CMD72_04460 [Gammaproteobacteria bacterium]|nr:hypothetical protein [Gammaproteobacteria bacterium]|tara:strand:- start:698 stop:1603 length:906 start_codon:yes stop_codon:yes gene_type:complete
MINILYNKIGSYSKNGSILLRAMGYNLRKIVKYTELSKRKSVINNKKLQTTFQVKEDDGFISFKGKDHLFYVEEVINIAKNEFSKLNTNAIDWKSKDHLYTGVLSNYKINEDSPIIKFALQKELINPIINYFGFVPVLSYVGVWFSPGINTSHSSSQLFHCDQADVRQLKVFVYCSNVTEHDGPVNLIEANKSKKLRYKLNYNYSDEGQCLPDVVIKEHVSESEWIPQIGPEGTVTLSDTSRCFHFGSRLSEKSNERLLMAFQFLSPCAFTLPAEINDKLPFSSFDANNFSKVERQILGIN